MMTKSFTLVFTSILTLLVSGEDQPKQHQEWRQLLGAEDFKTRDAVSIEIWEKGSDALIFLESLINDDDPELAARATAIARKLKLGVTPETPEKIVTLVDQYFRSPAKMKISVIEKLLAASEYEILLRLRRLEEDERVLTRVDAIIADIMPRIVRDHLNRGKVELAKEYLLLSPQFPHLIHYAHLLKQTGGLEEEIKRLSQAESPEDQARYLACLRVAGNPAKLRQAALKIGDDDTAVLSSLILGDHVPFLDSLLENRNPTLPQRHYVQWTLANHRGDAATQKKAYDALVYLSGMKSEQNGARMSLFRMGYGDFVVKSLEAGEITQKIDYHLGQEDYLKAQELIGIPNEDGFDQWLEGLSSKAEAEIKEKGRSVELDRLVSAVEFLEARGLVENAVKSACLLFDLVRLSGDLDASSLARRIYFSAPVSTYSAIAREIEKHDASLEEFLEMLPVNSYESFWLCERLAEIYPEMAISERLLLAMSFSSRRLLVPVASFTEARARILERVGKDEEQVENLTKLLTLLIRRNREDDLLTIAAALNEAGSPNHLLEAALAIDSGRLKEGAALSEKIDWDPETANAQSFYKKGLILKKAGIAEGDELIEKALLFSNGGIYALRGFAMEHLRYGEVTQAYELLQKALMRSESPTKPSQFGIRVAAIDELAAQTATLGLWKEALAYREVAALDAIYPSASQGVYVMRARFKILVARGAVAMQEDDLTGAVRAFTQAHRMLPRDGYLANELFPVLRALGLHELHDQLFSESAEDCRENIRLFPQDDNAYNNFAWLASRSNRSLDEAEEYLKTALEMNPESAAYLDTMGEIYFARQNRAEALAWSTKSLQNEILGNDRSRWELQQQHQRFKSGDFPPR